jgi:hypothetical protein
MKRVLTVAILAVACAVMVYAGASARQSGTRSTACHTAYPIAIKAKSSVKHGRTVTVTVSLTKSLRHGLSVTMQYRRSSSSKWSAYGTATQMTQTPFSGVRWRAPKRTGKYKLRVKAEFGDDTGSGTSYSGVRTITVY